MLITYIKQILESICKTTLLFIIHFYQQHISAKKGYRCAYHQHHGGLSCSAHAKNVLENQPLKTALSLIYQRRKDCSQVAKSNGITYTKLYHKSGLVAVTLAGLTGCSGGGDDNSTTTTQVETLPTNNTVNAPVSPSNNSSIDGIGGAGEIQCEPKLGAIHSSQIRQKMACDYAKKIYGDVANVTFNYDYDDNTYYSSTYKHTGIDLQGQPKGKATIKSLTSGTVHMVNDKGGSSGMVVVETQLADKPIQIAYLHMTNIKVKQGDIISPGDPLGTEGGRGNWNCNKGPVGDTCFSPHLHLEFRVAEHDEDSALKPLVKETNVQGLDPLNNEFYQAIMTGNFAKSEFCTFAGQVKIAGTKEVFSTNSCPSGQTGYIEVTKTCKNGAWVNEQHENNCRDLPPIQPTTPIYQPTTPNPAPTQPSTGAGTTVTPTPPVIQRPILEGGVHIQRLNDTTFALNSRTASGQVDYYELWRSNSAGYRGSKISQSTSNYFQDSPPMGQTVYYTIGACNNSGCSYSNQDYGKVEIARPQLSGGVNIQRLSNGFALNSRVATNVEYYTLYRSTYQGSKGVYLGRSQSNHFTDYNVQRGITYFYTISACNASGCVDSEQHYSKF